jgi:hypothetical protein
VALTGEGAARQVVAALMMLSAFEVLGVRPELGRFPTPEEDAPGGAAVAVLSRDLWVSQCAADPMIVGRVIYIDGGPREVIGVMPAYYDFPAPDVDLWVPLRLNPASGNFSAHYLSAIARLAPGSTIETATADARSLVGRLGEVGYGAAYFEGIFDGGAVVRPLRDFIAGGAETVAQFYDRLIERLAAVPGVERVGAIDALPLTGRGRALGTVIEEFPPAEGQFPPVFQIRRAAPGFFEAMSIPVVEGRALTPDDHQRRLGSVVISRSIKDTYWPGTSALGKRLTVSGTTAQVVGVVGDVHSTSLDAPVDRLVYLPMLDAEGGGGVEGMTLTLRASIDPLRLVAAIRSAIAELDPDIPLADVRPMQRIVGGASTSFA